MPVKSPWDGEERDMLEEEEVVLEDVGREWMVVWMMGPVPV